jgi:hypothetical protein
MTGFQFKKIICRFFGHKPAEYIDSHKKRRLKHNICLIKWDVYRITYCKRCGKELNKTKLYSNLTPEQYLKIHFFEE